MFKWVKRAARLGLFLLAVWLGLVYGIPWARAVLPGTCERWKTEKGICSVQTRDLLARLDEWTQNVLVPLSRRVKVQRAYSETLEAFQSLEQTLRERVGDERVDAAVRGADIALDRFERLVGGSGNEAREKLGAVPENARLLLARVRDSFEKLRDVLNTTSRRAEDVSSAVEETRKALDALSSALPKGGD